MREAEGESAGKTAKLCPISVKSFFYKIFDNIEKLSAKLELLIKTFESFPYAS